MGENAECPLLEEIAVIDVETTQHLILIDDARLFLNPPPQARARTIIGRRPEITAKFDGYIRVTDDVIVRLPTCLRDQFKAFISEQSQTTLRRVKNRFSQAAACFDQEIVYKRAASWMG